MAASLCRKSLLNYKNLLYPVQKRTGYIILIPETSEEVADFNVSSIENIPDFKSLNKQNCKQIVNKLAQNYDVGAWELDNHLKKKFEKSEKVDVFKNVIEPLEVISVPFLTAWGMAKTLYFADQSLLPAKTFAPLGERFLQVRTDKFGMNSIYVACKKHLEENGDKCTDEEKRVLKKFIWEGFHNGFELPKDKKVDLSKCFSILEGKRQFYENKIRYAKIIFKQIINDANFARECPLDFLRNTATDSENPHKGPWIVTLLDSVYYRFLEYCDSQKARYHIWLSYNQLCSKFGDKRFDATKEVEDILKNRKAFANVLGYPTYAHLAMKTKMAETVENVQSVLLDLLEPAKLAQEKEIFDLEKFAYLYGFNGSLELWDLPYWKRMQQKLVYNLDEMSLQEYFPLSQVLLGLFALCEQLFSITIEEQNTTNVWNSEVRYYRISDAKSKMTLGGFFLDPYARPGKHSSDRDDGYFIPVRPRSKICASLPLSSLIFTFMPPAEDKPSLLYFKDVQNLFEKFGSMLQYTLTQMNYSEVSGLSNIEWDAVGISKEFLRFWLCDRGTLESISGHYNTGEPLPSQILDNLCQVHKHLAGTELCREIYFSNLDLEMHLKDTDCITIADELWPKHLLFNRIQIDYHPYGFKEIFINPMGSSYYSNIWARMVAADAFQAFVEAGLNNQEQVSALGKRFRSTFLALGGGCSPAEVFRRFRGRDPTTKSLLELLNIKSNEVD